MKRFYFIFFFIIISTLSISAQTESKFDSGEKKSAKSREKGIHDLQMDGELRKTSEYREQLVEGGTKKYEKKFRKRKIQKGTIMGDCPGDPRSKFNKKNPYKHKG